MRNILISLLIVVMVSGCGVTKDITEEKETSQRWTTKLSLSGTAQLFTTETSFMNQAPVIEISLINDNGKLIAYYDKWYCGNMSIAESVDNINFINGQTIKDNIRFPYTIKHNGIFYTAYTNQNDKNMYLMKSLNGTKWSLINNGQPIIKHSDDENSIFYQIWNPSFIIDKDETIRMYIECQKKSSGQDATGLSYAYGKIINDNVIMTTTENHVIGGTSGINAACSYVTELNDGKIGIIYAEKDNANTKAWSIKAGVLTNCDRFEYRQFSIEQKGIPLCDPHMVETSDGLMISFSYDQNFSVVLKGNCSIDDIFLR